MDPFTKSARTILMLAKQQELGPGDLVTFDIASKKIEPLADPVLSAVSSPGVCRLDESRYLIAGGFDKATSKVSSKAYILDINTMKCESIADMRVARFDAECVLYQEKVFVISGRESKDTRVFSPKSEYYDLKSKEWRSISDFSGKINRIQRLFIQDDKIVCVINKTSLSHYDDKEDKWTDVKTFVYDIDNFYIAGSKTSLLISSDHRTICSYDYFADTIMLYMFIWDVEGSESFYVKELDSIVFLDNYNRSSYVVFDHANREFYFYDQSAYAKTFMSYVSVKSFDNYHLDKPTSVEKQGRMKSTGSKTMNIFGNYNLPLHLELNLTDDSVDWEVKSIPERLHLKREQGLTRYDDDYLLFAGGIDEKREYIPTSDTYLYNPKSKDLKAFAPLSHTSDSTVLKHVVQATKFNGFKKTSDDKFFIYCMDSSTAPQVYYPSSNKWTDCESYRYNSLATLLDEDDKLVAMFTDRSPKDPSTYIFYIKLLDTTTNTWKVIHQKPTKSYISYFLCHKLARDSYLVVTVEEQGNLYLSQMDLSYDETGVKDANFTRLSLIDKYVNGINIINFTDGDNLVLIYVSPEYKLRVVMIDLATKKVVDNKRIRAIDKALREVSANMRLYRNSEFATFSFIASD